MAHEPVFISHASLDDAFVTRLHDGLETAGIDAWVDHKDILPSDNFSQSIQTAIQTRRYCVFVLSPNSATNENTEAEWWHYLNQAGRRLYVVLKAPVDTTHFPWRLKTVQYVDCSTDFEDGLNTLIASIQARRAVREDDRAVGVGQRITGRFPHGQLDIPLTGRDADLSNVKALLSDENRRLLVLTAVGGTGKTRLAAEVTVSAAEFSDGVIWLTLSKTSTEADLTAALRDHLNAAPTDSADVVWESVGQARVLLVLDNAESVPVSERPAIAARLKDYPTGGGTRALMTSREQWKETRPFNRAYPLEALPVEAAEQVLRDMAKAQGVAGKLAGREREFTLKAHRHPRLMSYAIGWLASGESLGRVVKMLETHTGDDMEAILEDVLHSTLRQIETTATAGAQVVADFKRLLVCKGGFSESAADALIGEGSPSLGVLCRWNLLTFSNGRYTPDLLAEAVLDVDETAYPLHYEFYFTLARQHDKTQDYLGLDIESDNLAAAFASAMQAGEYEQALWLCNACGQFLLNRGRIDQFEIWLKVVAMRLETHIDDRLKAAVQVSLGVLYKNFPTGNRRDNLQRAIACYRAALVYTIPETNPIEYATVQNNLGTVYGDLAKLENRADNLKRAIGCYQAALVYTTPATTPMDYAMTQNNLGTVYTELASVEDRADNLKRAIIFYQAALVYLTAESVPLYYATTQNNLGNTFGDLAEVQDRVYNLLRAIDCYEAALLYRTPKAAPLGYATTKANIGIAYQNLDETDKMCAAWREAELYFREMGYIEYADKVTAWLARAGCSLTGK